MSNLFLLKKVNIKLFFLVFYIGFLVGCSNLDISNEIEIFENGNVSYEFTSESIIESPFIEPLLEFFKGGIDVPDYWDIDSTKSFFVDIDGNGTQGILAIRYEGEYNHPFAYAKIFYIYNNKLLYKDLGSIAGFPLSVNLTGKGRVVQTAGDAGSVSYTLFTIENEKLTYYFTITKEGIDDIFYYLSYSDFGDSLEMRSPITEKMFNEIIAQYSLYDFGWHERYRFNIENF